MGNHTTEGDASVPHAKQRRVVRFPHRGRRKRPHAKQWRIVRFPHRGRRKRPPRYKVEWRACSTLRAAQAPTTQCSGEVRVFHTQGGASAPTHSHQLKKG